MPSATSPTRPRILVLHVPRWEVGRREIMVLPLGLPALVNLLADHGYAVTFAHLGIERQRSKQFSLRKLVIQAQPDLVLLSLHWYPQVRDVLRVAKAVGVWAPHARVVLGGMTATWFARDLLEQMPFVHGVVRGDAEVPVLQLADTCRTDNIDRAWTKPANLMWRRRDRTIVDNGLTYHAGQFDLSQLRHGDLSLLRNWREYVAQSLYADFSEGGRDSGGYALGAYLNAGRGCTASCVNCGGAASSQRTLFGRSGVLLYPLDKLMRDTNDAVAQGARTLRCSFDPPAGRRHVRRWFEAIRSERIELKLIYDAWYLPTRGLLNDIAETFRDPLVVVSPESGSERVRFQVRGLPFTNEQLLKSLALAESLGVRTHCFFSAGLPGETRADVTQSAALIRQLRRNTSTEISVCPMVADPASPLFVNPKPWGARLTRSTLRDFYDHPGMNWGPGYETSEFTEHEILEACNYLLEEAGLPKAYNNP